MRILECQHEFLLILAQNQVLQLFIVDFSTPFKRQDFVAFLKLTPEVAALVLSIATEEVVNLKRTTGKIYQQSFDTLHSTFIGTPMGTQA